MFLRFNHSTKFVTKKYKKTKRIQLWGILRLSYLFTFNSCIFLFDSLFIFYLFIQTYYLADSYFITLLLFAIVFCLSAFWIFAFFFIVQQIRDLIAQISWIDLLLHDNSLQLVVSKKSPGTGFAGTSGPETASLVGQT